MSDEADVGNDNMELFLKAAINAHNRQINSGLIPVGLCHYCESEVAQGALFCPGLECRDDYEQEKRLKKITGER